MGRHPIASDRIRQALKTESSFSRLEESNQKKPTRHYGECQKKQEKTIKKD